MSILWITLAVLAGAFIVGGTAIYFLRARFMENLQADPTNIASVAAPVTVAEEVRSIGDQIEKAMSEQRLQGETQRQLLAQKLDSVRHTLDDQKQQVGGLRNELRHEIQRRDHEMSEIRNQISTIQTTIALPPASEPQAALPPASVPEDNAAPTAEAPEMPTEAPAHEAAFEDVQFPISAPTSEAPAPGPDADEATFEEPTFEEPTFETIEQEPIPETEVPDAFAFEVMSADDFAPVAPQEPEAPPAPETSMPEPTPTPAEVPAPEAAPVTDFEPVDFPAAEVTPTQAEGSAPAPTFETVSFVTPDEPAPTPEPASVPEPQRTPEPEPVAEMESEPTFEPVSFAPSPQIEGDSFADVSFSDVDLSTASPTEPAPASEPETGSVFEPWTPAADDVEAPVPFSTSDLLTLPSDPAAESAAPQVTAEAPAIAAPAQPEPAPETSWVARPDRPEPVRTEHEPVAETMSEPLTDVSQMEAPQMEAPQMEAPQIGIPQPIVASADDFLPSPTAQTASVPPLTSPAQAAPAPTAPTVEEPVQPESAPAPEAVVVEPTIIEPLGEEPTASAEPDAPAIPDGADDLTVISSIDEATQALLFAEGVMTLDEIARWGRGEARRIGASVQVSEETIMNQWVFEAQAALFDQFTNKG